MVHAPQLRLLRFVLGDVREKERAVDDTDMVNGGYILHRVVQSIEADQYKGPRSQGKVGMLSSRSKTSADAALAPTTTNWGPGLAPISR